MFDRFDSVNQLKYGANILYQFTNMFVYNSRPKISNMLVGWLVKTTLNALRHAGQVNYQALCNYQWDLYVYLRCTTF